MGYMGLETITDSDLAADLSANVLSKVAKELKKGLKEKGNSLNTEGCVNVALFFEQCFCKTNDPCIYLHEDLYNIALETKEQLEELIAETTKDKEEWDAGSWREHMSAYRRMLKNINKFIAMSED